MTNSELTFYNKLTTLKQNYEIVPQVNLATIIEKKGNSNYRNELFKNIDFAVFSKNYDNLLLLIELNDKSHNESKRHERDINLKMICQSANIKLITFYTNYENKEQYVINRILEEIKR